MRCKREDRRRVDSVSVLMTSYTHLGGLLESRINGRWQLMDQGGVVVSMTVRGKQRLVRRMRREHVVPSLRSLKKHHLGSLLDRIYWFPTATATSASESIFTAARPLCIRRTFTLLRLPIGDNWSASQKDWSRWGIDCLFPRRSYRHQRLSPSSASITELSLSLTFTLSQYFGARYHSFFRVKDFEDSVGGCQRCTRHNGRLSS